MSGRARVIGQITGGVPMAGRSVAPRETQEYLEAARNAPIPP
jgi:hypothetical protein